MSREGQAALPAPNRTRRQVIRVKTPCGECRLAGLCAIEHQIEDNLVLEIIEIGRNALLSLVCSEFEPAWCDMQPRVTWSEARRARFQATIELRRAHRSPEQA